MSGFKFTNWQLPEDVELKEYFTTDYGSMDEEYRNKLLYGEWKMELVGLLVLYSKGNKRDLQHTYGKENVHYVNTSRIEVRDIVQGHRYNDVLVLDTGVSREDINIAMQYKVV